MISTVVSIAENIRAVRERMAKAAERAGRNINEITLIAVSKTVQADRIEDVISAGVAILGENRVQEAASKIHTVGGKAEWHFIGHLQGNKARTAVELFDVIESVDSLKLANSLSRLAVESGREKLRVLLEVNMSGEASKHGFDPTALPRALDDLLALEGLDIRGLMTIGPLTGGAEATRATFRDLRRLRDELENAHSAVSLPDLSMGMTGDFETAIEEGSTMVRVGRAIFGERRQ